MLFSLQGCDDVILLYFSFHVLHTLQVIFSETYSMIGTAWTIPNYVQKTDR
jgi:hypothetical protein